MPPSTWTVTPVTLSASTGSVCAPLAKRLALASTRQPPPHALPSRLVPSVPSAQTSWPVSWTDRVALAGVLRTRQAAGVGVGVGVSVGARVGVGVLVGWVCAWAER